MAKRKRRFGNPAQQAAIDVAVREQAREAEAAKVAAARQRRESGCSTTGCGCGDACCA